MKKGGTFTSRDIFGKVVESGQIRPREWRDPTPYAKSRYATTVLQLQSSKELASPKGPRYTSIPGGRQCALWVNRILEEDGVDSPPCCKAVQEDFREAGLE